MNAADLARVLAQDLQDLAGFLAEAELPQELTRRIADTLLRQQRELQAIGEEIEAAGG